MPAGGIPFAAALGHSIPVSGGPVQVPEAKTASPASVKLPVSAAPTPPALSTVPHPVLWASVTDDDEEDGDELAPQTPLIRLKRIYNF
jgi:hypothetical protein